jgi:hypothetical protein
MRLAPAILLLWMVFSKSLPLASVIQWVKEPGIPWQWSWALWQVGAVLTASYCSVCSICWNSGTGPPRENVWIFSLRNAISCILGILLAEYNCLYKCLWQQSSIVSISVCDSAIDILYTLDSASNYSAIQKLKPWLQAQDIPMKWEDSYVFYFLTRELKH